LKFISRESTLVRYCIAILQLFTGYLQNVSPKILTKKAQYNFRVFFAFERVHFVELVVDIMLQKKFPKRTPCLRNMSYKETCPSQLATYCLTKKDLPISTCSLSNCRLHLDLVYSKMFNNRSSTDKVEFFIFHIPSFFSQLNTLHSKASVDH